MRNTKSVGLPGGEGRAGRTGRSLQCKGSRFPATNRTCGTWHRWGRPGEVSGRWGMVQGACAHAPALPAPSHDCSAQLKGSGSGFRGPEDLKWRHMQAVASGSRLKGGMLGGMMGSNAVMRVQVQPHQHPVCGAVRPWAEWAEGYKRRFPTWAEGYKRTGAQKVRRGRGVEGKGTAGVG